MYIYLFFFCQAARPGCLGGVCYTTHSQVSGALTRLSTAPSSVVGRGVVCRGREVEAQEEQEAQKGQGKVSASRKALQAKCAQAIVETAPY